MQAFFFQSWQMGRPFGERLAPALAAFAAAARALRLWLRAFFLAAFSAFLALELGERLGFFRSPAGGQGQGGRGRVENVANATDWAWFAKWSLIVEHGVGRRKV